MSMYNKLKRFYNKSFENRMGIFNLLAFFMVPAIGLAFLYIIVMGIMYDKRFFVIVILRITPASEYRHL